MNTPDIFTYSLHRSTIQNGSRKIPAVPIRRHCGKQTVFGRSRVSMPRGDATNSSDRAYVHYIHTSLSSSSLPSTHESRNILRHSVRGVFGRYGRYIPVGQTVPISKNRESVVKFDRS